MSALTLEWVAKAEGDFRVTLREARATDPPEPDAVCYHAQQSIEKYAKAYLTEKGTRFRRTHDMEYLLGKCAEVDPAFARHLTDFQKLEEYSVDIRYPGDFAAEEDARAAVEIMLRLRAFFRQKLGLDEPSPSKESDNA